MKYIIGLTGNIAVGKSAVLNILRELGAEVIDADAVTREVMARGQRAYKDIVAAFGPAILGPDRQIDRPALGRRVFSDPAALRRLEQIVHPATIERISRQIEHSPAGVIVIEAIKLIESGMVARLCDTLWVVAAPPEAQLRRLMEQRGMGRADAEQRIAAQPPQSEKIAAAKLVIRNAGTLEETRRQVIAAWETIPAEYRQGGV